MTVVPATRHRQEVEVALEAADSYARVELPDGRAVIVYGNGQLNILVGTETRYHRVPAAEDPVSGPPRPVSVARPARRVRAVQDPPAPVVASPAPVVPAPAPAPARATRRSREMPVATLDLRHRNGVRS